MSEQAVQHEQSKRELSVNVNDGRSDKLMKWISIYGLGTVFFMVYLFGMMLPEQRARLEREKVVDTTNARMSETLHQIGQTMVMLVDQDRRRENSTQEVLRIQQEQTRILQQIMVDQKRGAWNDAEKTKTSNHAVMKQD